MVKRERFIVWVRDAEGRHVLGLYSVNLQAIEELQGEIKFDLPGGCTLEFVNTREYISLWTHFRMTAKSLLSTIGRFTRLGRLGGEKGYLTFSKDGPRLTRNGNANGTKPTSGYGTPKP